MHQRQRAWRQRCERTDRRPHVRAQAGVLEQVLGGDCRTDDVALGQRR